MIHDKILEIQIDDVGRLCIKPKIEKFTLIYRSATEVHWDYEGNFLFSPKPSEWSYLDWYKHIISTITIEYNCQLDITNDTIWISIPIELKTDILAYAQKIA